ncbi:hypothetical protein GGS20DRAFT_162345 [Poronia punctata]|nr:hypothetical protein GGS20DRAFT_162345 [Poronia punctata]
MAPVPTPDGGHYSGASPLDGGPNPSTLGGGSTRYRPTPAEIGVIVAVVVVVIGVLIWIFFWRARKARQNGQTQSTAAAQGYDQELTDASGLHISAPLQKEDRASTADNDDVSTIERPPRSHLRPTANWAQRAESPQFNHEPHEFPSRH